MYNKRGRKPKPKTEPKRAVPIRKKLTISRSIRSSPPSSQTVCLIYNEPVFFTSTGGAISTTIWRINDLFDPYQTGIGRQPLFRDQMFALYRSARVLGAQIKVDICSSTGQTSPMRVALTKCESGTADAGVSVACERRPGVNRIYNPQGGVVSMKLYMTSDQYFGLAKGSTLRDNDFLQVSNASLTADKAMWVQLVAADITGGTCTIYTSVTIKMYVRFENPLQVAGS